MSESVSELSRAAPGEQVLVVLRHVKADKCKEFEHLHHDIFKPADLKIRKEKRGAPRILHPTEQNEDGTYTYVVLFDPWIRGALPGGIEGALRSEYGEERARKYLEDRENCCASPGVGYLLTQSEH
jgi:hypothetical protein